MKAKDRALEALKKLGQYKYVLLVALVGALLLLLPTGEGRASPSPSAAPGSAAESDLFRTAELEGELEAALARIEGVGEVTVVLTVSESPRSVLDEGGSAVQALGPDYRGALVVAQGGGDPQVRLKLFQAVSALTGLGADKIQVCQGK